MELGATRVFRPAAHVCKQLFEEWGFAPGVSCRFPTMLAAMPAFFNISGRQRF